MTIRLGILIVGLFLARPIYGQDVEFVRAEVAALSDSGMSGRGYIKRGSELAARYIANRFEEIGLETGDLGRLQFFTITVNTFPHKTTVAWGSDTLREGFAYIIDPRSGSTGGTFEPLVLDSMDFSGDVPPPLPKASQVPVIDTRGLASADLRGLLHAYTQMALETSPAIWLQSDKLIWSVGTPQFAHALVEVDRHFVGEHVPDSISIDIQTESKEVNVKNVIGKIPGLSADSSIVVSAHYDHLGMMGSAIFRGAGDNASGTATLLDLAKHYIAHPPKQDIWFIAFAAEEAGLKGSTYFVEHPTIDLNRVKMVINLDLLGSAAKGIAVVNGKAFPNVITTLKKINAENNMGLNIKVRGNAPNSDHYPFTQVGVPAIFIYTEGNIRAYHDVYDVPEVVDWANYPEVFTLLTGLIDSLQE